MDGLKPPLRPILEEEAARHGMTVERFIAPVQLRERVRMRQYAMWRMRNETGRSWSDIARAFGKDHTTIQYGYRVIEALPPDERSKIPYVKRPFTKPPAQMFHGKPCRNGHIGIRYRSNGACVECQNEWEKQRYHRLKKGKQHEQKASSSPNFQCTAEAQNTGRTFAEGAR